MIVPEPSAALTMKLDPIALLVHASTPVRLTVGLLLIAGTGVWLIAVLKLIQIARLRSKQRAFEDESASAQSGRGLYDAATMHDRSPGGRIVLLMASRASATGIDRMRSIAERAIVDERARATTLMSTLGSIAAASPFIGLFGTVYGIMDAFIRIGQEKSASLPVVAPAIGEALVTTAIGLAAAIPAVIFYNMIDKQVSDLLDQVESSVSDWALTLLVRSPAEASATQARPSSHFPSPPSTDNARGHGR
jgi:biopolymer transport protein TolQ